jgi:alanine racemase
VLFLKQEHGCYQVAACVTSLIRMTGNHPIRPSHVVVDLRAIASNVRAVRAALAPGVRFMAVVKADAYGHGSVRVSKVALGSGADCLGVSTLEEAEELRAAGVEAPIVVLTPELPDRAPWLVSADVQVVVGDLVMPRALSAVAVERGAEVALHLKVDTGMGRYGVHPTEAVPLARAIANLPGVHLLGVMTHFPSADEKDLSYTRDQIEALHRVLSRLAAEGIVPEVVAAANTAGVALLLESHLTMVRVGYMLYGLYPSDEVPRTVHVLPAMSVVSALNAVKRVPAEHPVGYGRSYYTARETLLGLVPCGYADGYDRALSNSGWVLVRGRRAKIIGRISMDSFAVDLTDCPDAVIGDEVVMVGRQGSAEISANDLAQITGTLGYEIISRMGKRLPRRYIGDANGEVR